MKTIKITEDVKLPGTNVILEKGDRVQVLDEGVIELQFPFWVRADDYHEFDIIRTVLNGVLSVKRLRIDYKEQDWDTKPPNPNEPVVGIGDYVARFFLK